MSTENLRTNRAEMLPIWDMLGAKLPRGVIGLSDPDVHEIEGRWVMFIGGFSSTFRNRLYRATLPIDTPPSRGPAWRFDPHPIITDPPGQAWDSGGMHTPSYVPADAGDPARIYYAGRASSRHYGEESRYSIGVLTQRPDDSWERHETPVIQGGPGRPSVLEPCVIRTGGGFRAWFLSTPHEVGPGEQPDFELRVSDSSDGLTWQRSACFASSAEGFFDNAVYRTPLGWEMMLARGTNLHATTPYPAQGLWVIRAPTPSAERSQWSSPQQVLDTDVAEAPSWLGRGVCGPSVIVQHDGRRVVFVTGTHRARSWLSAAGHRLLRHGRWPVPAPYWLATGIVVLTP